MTTTHITRALEALLVHLTEAHDGCAYADVLVRPDGRAEIRIRDQRTDDDLVHHVYEREDDGWQLVRTRVRGRSEPPK